MRRLLPLVPCLAVLLWLCPAGRDCCRAGESPADENLRSLVAGLEADEKSRYEVAGKELLLLGGAAVPALEAAAKKEGLGAAARERIEQMLERLRPLADLASPNRGVRIAAATEANGTAEELFDEGNPAAALAFYRLALPAYPGLLDSPYVRGCIARTVRALPGEAQAAFAKTDLGLFLAGRLGDLHDAHPGSWLAGKAIYDDGRFEEYVRLFPDGFYAPQSRYCLISGYKSYARTDDRPRRLSMTDPDREVREWPQFLKDFPDFEGADDASYRLARALEEKARPVDACLQLRHRLGDGDMEPNALERLLFVMDAKMSAQELTDLRTQLEKDALPREKLLLPNADLAALTLYLEALKLLRDGRYGEAGQAFARVPKQQAELPEAAEPEQKAEAEDEGEDDGGGEGDEDDSPLAGLDALVAERSEFAAKAARLAGNATAAQLAKLAELMCSERSQHVFMTGMNWAGGPDISSYDAATGPEEFFRRRSRFWQAARVCERLLAEHPKAEEAADATYLLALCHCRMAETHWTEHRSAFWRKAQVENVKKSIDWYVRFARDYPEDARFGKARHAADYLTEKWFWKKGGPQETEAGPEADEGE